AVHAGKAKERQVAHRGLQDCTLDGASGLRYLSSPLYENRYLRCASQPSCGARLNPDLANSIQRPMTNARSAFASVTGSPGHAPPACAILSDCLIDASMRS